MGRGVQVWAATAPCWWLPKESRLMSERRQKGPEGHHPPLLHFSTGNTRGWLVAPHGAVKLTTPRRVGQRSKREQVAQKMGDPGGRRVQMRGFAHLPKEQP